MIALLLAYRKTWMNFPNCLKKVKGIITVNEDAVGAEFEESITLELTGKERVRYSVPVKRMLQGKARTK